MGKSHALTLDVYQATQSFPSEERFGLTSQMRRSASSVPSNIAEGCMRGSDSDFARFLQIAVASSSELDYQILLSHDLGYISQQIYETLSAQVSEVKRMINGFIQSLRKDTN